MAFDEPDAGQRVLLVEDDAALAEMYKLKLELDGHALRVAPDGEAGLLMATEFKPDLIFLDIAMPSMDGLTLLDVMRADKRLSENPILILTNHDDSETERRSLELGAREFLAKSKTTPDAVAGWVRRLGDRRRRGWD